MAQRATTPRKGASSKRTGARSRPTGRRAKTAPVSEARTTREDDSLPQHAEEAQGRPLPDFAVEADDTDAQETIESEHTSSKVQMIHLSRRDQEAIAEALINPPKPTPAMKRAFELHRKLVRME